MSQKWYDILAYVGRIVLPALATAVLALGEVWTIPNYQEIATTITIIATLLNALLKLESNNYFSKEA